jgi:CRP/FNR family cyclic AMP-dependent transcriptional regulator
MGTVVDHLRQVPLFQGMTDRAITAVATLASEIEFPDGTALTTQGEPGEAFFLVVAGSVSVARNGSVQKTLGPGDFIGEIALVDGRPRTATATAVGNVEALVIGRESFLQLMDTYPAVRLGILMALTERIRTDEQTAPA